MTGVAISLLSLVLFVQLEDGIPLLQTNLGSGPEQLSLANASLSDSLWHFVAIHRTGLELSAAVDEVMVAHTLQGPHTVLDINPEAIFAGGQPSSEDDTLVMNMYVGCLDDVRIDQQQLPVSGSNSFASVRFAGDSEISYSCALGGCLPEPCGRGNCSEREGSNYECSCEIGVTTFSQSCPLTVSPPMFTLAIIIGVAASGLIVCVLTFLACT